MKTYPRPYSAKEILIKEFEFYMNCTMVTNTKDIEALNHMCDEAIDITWKTFIKHVSIKEIRELFDWYDYHGHGLHIKDDWSVSFRRSKFKNKRCYFIIHSGIEYIFIKN